MTLISISKALLPVFFILLVFQVSGSHYYDHSSDLGIDEQGFSVPEYESNAEIASELVAPFLFLTILLKFGFQKVLLFTFASDDYDRHPYDYFNNNAQNFSRESTLMAVTVTAMLIPTPFWNYIRWAASSLGLIAATILVLAMLYLIISFIRG